MGVEKEPVRGPEAAEKGRKPIEVRNRDIPALSEVLYIMQDVCQIERRREWQHDRMTHITQRLTGMPGGGALPKGFDDALSLLSEIDDEHEKLCKAYVRQLRRAQRILNGIQSLTMRTFVLMKYVMDVPDAEIRNELNMTRRGFDRARRAVEDAPSMASVKWQERYIIAQREEK